MSPWHRISIGNHIWPIKWHKCQWPWMTLKVTLAIWHFLTYFLENKTRSKFDVCIRIGEDTRDLRPWMTLKIIHQFQSFGNASRLHLCSTLQDFNWHTRVARFLGTAGLLVVNLSLLWSEVICAQICWKFFHCVVTLSEKINNTRITSNMTNVTR